MKKIGVISAGVLILLVIGAVVFLAVKRPADKLENEKETTQTILYQDPAGLSFSYPSSWGQVTVAPGNKECPEEDTYRTPDGLSIRDRELRFPEVDLENTDSMMRIGIATYTLDPKKLPDCNYEMLGKLATKEITGEEISSFKMTPVSIDGFYGVFNESASRLDTEARSQYTLFVKNDDGTILVVQPYLSFIPYADSPEWQEIDSAFRNDAGRYIREGKTAEQIRAHLADFKKMAESLTMNNF